MKDKASEEKSGDKSLGAIAFGLNTLHLVDFRNYASANVTLVEGFNVISGANAQGKTNLLEAVYLLSTARLLRGQRDAEAVRHGASKARVEGALQGVSTGLAIELAAGVRKRAFLNGLGMPRAADLLGRLPTVCITAADMEIVRGEPSERRMFLDLELSALHPAYLQHLTHYKRALEQRNALLKDSREWMKPAETFEVWEDQIAEHGMAIRTYRIRYLDVLRPTLVDIHHEMGDGEGLSARYEARDTACDRDDLYRLLTAGRGADVARGATSQGPHRDDVVFEIDGRDARLYGSQGQQRTAVIALKIASLQVASQELGATPVLLLDDIFSDLDSRRREHLVKLVLERAQQALLTCTETSAAGPEILHRAKLFQVKAGTIIEG